jgi:hypothetical protein
MPQLAKEFVPYRFLIVSADALNTEPVLFLFLYLHVYDNIL